MIDKISNRPNPDEAFPNPKIPSLCYIKNVVKNPRIIIGEYTYYDDVDGADQFEKHVTHFYDFIGDKLIIGKFCAIAKGIEFVMNGANHRMGCATTYPFYIMGGDWGNAIAPVKEELPLKGDTIVDNDVWIGQNVTVMPGVHIGDGAIIGANSVVAKDIPPYVLCGREPICYAGVNIVGLRRRGFSPEVIRNIKDIYDTIYFSGYNISDGCAKVEAGFPQSEERDTILNFIKESKRGIIRAYDNKVKGEID